MAISCGYTRYELNFRSFQSKNSPNRGSLCGNLKKQFFVKKLISAFFILIEFSVVFAQNNESEKIKSISNYFTEIKNATKEIRTIK